MAKTFSGFWIALVFLVSPTAAPFIVGSAHTRLSQTTQRQLLRLKTTLRVGAVDRFSLSPDDKSLLIVTRNHEIQVWDLTAAKVKATINGFPQSPIVEWSPTGDRFLTITQKKAAAVWDARTGDKLYDLPESFGLGLASGPSLLLQAFSNLNWSPDGRWLAVTQSKKTTAVWNLQTGRPQCQTPESTYEVNARSWSPEPGILMVVSWDHGLKSALGLAKSELQLWDVGTCNSRFVSRMNGHVDAEFTTDGAYILTKPDPLSSADNREPPQLWNATTGNAYLAFQSVPCPRKNCGPDTAILSPDGKLAAVGYIPSRIEIWDIQSGRVLGSIHNDQWDEVGIKGFSPDSRLLAVYREHSKSLTSFKTISSIELYDAQRAALRTTLSGENMRLSAHQIVWRRDSGMVVTAGGSQGYEGKIWDVSTGKLIATLPLIAKEGHTPFTAPYFDDLDRLSFHPTLPLLIGRSNKLMKIWNPENGNLLQTIGLDRGVWSENRQLMISLSKDEKSIEIWELS